MLFQCFWVVAVGVTWNLSFTPSASYLTDWWLHKWKKCVFFSNECSIVTFTGPALKHLWACRFLRGFVSKPTLKNWAAFHTDVFSCLAVGRLGWLICDKAFSHIFFIYMTAWTTYKHLALLTLPSLSKFSDGPLRAFFPNKCIRVYTYFSIETGVSACRYRCRSQVLAWNYSRWWVNNCYASSQLQKTGNWDFICSYAMRSNGIFQIFLHWEDHLLQLS